MLHILQTFFMILMHASLFLYHAYAIDSNYQYHLPCTDAEAKASQIINIATGLTPGLSLPDNHWEKLSTYIATWPHKNPNLELQYQNLFTMDFIYGWARQEEASVKLKCNGQYSSNSICGLDFIALTCSKENGGIYLYRTLAESDYNAIIAVIWYSSWPSLRFCIVPRYDLKDLSLENNEMALYSLVKRNGTWRLDGLLCRPDGHTDPYFHINFPSR